MLTNGSFLWYLVGLVLFVTGMVYVPSTLNANVICAMLGTYVMWHELLL